MPIPKMYISTAITIAVETGRSMYILFIINEGVRLTIIKKSHPIKPHMLILFFPVVDKGAYIMVLPIGNIIRRLTKSLSDQQIDATTVHMISIISVIPIEAKTCTLTYNCLANVSEAKNLFPVKESIPDTSIRPIPINLEENDIVINMEKKFFSPCGSTTRKNIIPHERKTTPNVVKNGLNAILRYILTAFFIFFMIYSSQTALIPIHSFIK
jgi:hypothetical protein